MRCNKLFISLFVFFPMFAYAQPSIIWQECFGGTADDYFYNTIKTNDGGIVACARCASIDGDLSSSPDCDGWVIKFDSSLHVEWQQLYIGEIEPLKSVELKHSGYLFGGACGVEHISTHGFQDILLMQTDSLGEILWSNCYGGILGDDLVSVQATQDGGFLVLGSSYGAGGDIPFHYGEACCNDAVIFKTDSLGNILWLKVLGGSLYDSPIANAVETSRGIYQIHIFSSSDDYDLADCPVTDSRKRWIIEMDSMGNILRENFLSAEDDYLNFENLLYQDGVYIISVGTGNAESPLFPAPVGHAGEEGSIAFFDSTLNLVNMISFGGSGEDRFNGMTRDSAGNYYFVGISSSTDYDLPGNYNDGITDDYWLMATDSNFNLLWSRNFGGSHTSGDDMGSAEISDILIKSGVIYVFTGAVTPDELPDYDIACGHQDVVPDIYDERDAWVVAFSIPNAIHSATPSELGMTIFPNPAETYCKISISGTLNPTHIQILDATQRVVHEGKYTPDMSITLDHFKPGVYMLCLYNHTGLLDCEKLLILR